MYTNITVQTWKIIDVHVSLLCLCLHQSGTNADHVRFAAEVRWSFKKPPNKNAVPLTETFQRQLPILGNCARATGYVEYYWFAKSMEKWLSVFWAISKKRFSKNRQISKNYAFSLVKCIARHVYGMSQKSFRYWFDVNLSRFHEYMHKNVIFAFLVPNDLQLCLFHFRNFSPFIV